MCARLQLVAVTRMARTPAGGRQRKSLMLGLCCLVRREVTELAGIKCRAAAGRVSLHKEKAPLHSPLFGVRLPCLFRRSPSRTQPRETRDPEPGPPPHLGRWLRLRLEWQAIFKCFQVNTSRLWAGKIKSMVVTGAWNGNVCSEQSCDSGSNDVCFHASQGFPIWMTVTGNQKKHYILNEIMKRSLLNKTQISEICLKEARVCITDVQQTRFFSLPSNFSMNPGVLGPPALIIILHESKSPQTVPL